MRRFTGFEYGMGIGGWLTNYKRFNVLLNLHKAVGNYCDIQEEVELLDDEGLQERFIALWLAFENRYAQDNSIAFELLNEVREVDPVKWNQLAQKTINAIRHADIRWRENWMRDVIAFLKEQEIPYCVWNYLSTPNDGNRFSLVDDDNRQILSEKMARIIRGKEV